MKPPPIKEIQDDLVCLLYFSGSQTHLNRVSFFPCVSNPISPRLTRSSSTVAFLLGFGEGEGEGEGEGGVPVDGRGRVSAASEGSAIMRYIFQEGDRRSKVVVSGCEDQKTEMSNFKKGLALKEL